MKTKKTLQTVEMFSADTLVAETPVNFTTLRLRCPMADVHAGWLNAYLYRHNLNIVKKVKK